MNFLIKLLWVVLASFALIDLVIVPISIIKLFNFLKSRNKKIFTIILSVYSILLIIKLFIVSIVDLGAVSNYQIVLKFSPTLFNTQVIPMLDSQVSPSGPLAFWNLVGSWYSSKSYLHLGYLSPSQQILFTIIIASWWVITFIVIPLTYLVLKKQSKFT